MTVYKVLAAAAALALTAGGVNAADPLAYYGGTCMWHKQNQIIHQSTAVIRDIVEFNYADARATLAHPSAVGSGRPAFVWAMEANNACSIALGYIAAGNYHAESIQKCDCFHTRMVSYR